MESKDNPKVPCFAMVQNYDLIIRLQKSEAILPQPNDGPTKKIVPMAMFQVDKATLIKFPTASKRHDNFFQKMLTEGFKEAQQRCVTLEDDEPDALRLFLSIVHDLSTEFTATVSHKVVWPLVTICDKYNIDLDKFKTWFANWYEMKGEEIDDIDAREMLYPCWKFDHAPGFLKASKECIYTIQGHIWDKNPTKYPRLELPNRVGQQLNAARGRLKTITHAGVFSPVERLLDFSCSCDGPSNKTLPSGASPPCTCDITAIEPRCSCGYATASGYIRALRRTEAWPLELNWHKLSVNIVMNRFKDFNFTRKGSCYYCCHDYNSLMENAINNIRTYVDGLCLDCMAASKSGKMISCNDWDWDGDDIEMVDEYMYKKRLKEWSRGCRVKHGEPTWYFSSMARKDKD